MCMDAVFAAFGRLGAAQERGGRAIDVYKRQVTNHPELSLKGYTVHAQDYIIKPVEQERIDAAMDYIARNCRLKELSLIHI